MHHGEGCQGANSESAAGKSKAWSPRLPSHSKAIFPPPVPELPQGLIQLLASKDTQNQIGSPPSLPPLKEESNRMRGDGLRLGNRNHSFSTEQSGSGTAAQGVGGHCPWGCPRAKDVVLKGVGSGGMAWGAWRSLPTLGSLNLGCLKRLNHCCCSLESNRTETAPRLQQLQVTAETRFLQYQSHQAGLSHTIKLTVVTSLIFLQRFLFLVATVVVLVT